MIDPRLCERMKADWNARAGEDAHYYVAFGRRQQSEDEFFETAREMAVALERELRRLPPAPSPRVRRALEIGCGPGRLMRPLSRHFGEIHGVDVSDEMVRLARDRLRGIPHAHVHATSGADLAPFADDSFDFVYSYAVFQHIPSAEVVFAYLREARRVLKEGGILRCQMNGLPESAARYDTWSGVRISAEQAASFAREHDFQLLALEGAATQYMWLTLRKRAPGWEERARNEAWPEGVRIRRITNSHSSEPVAPPRGRFAAVSLWIENLPECADINHLEILIGARKAACTYIGPAEADRVRQVNALVPEGTETGLQPVELRRPGAACVAAAVLRVIPPPPPAPRLVAVTDGIDLLSEGRILSGSVKVTLEEIFDISQLRATIDGVAAPELDVFCTDPRVPRHEVNFRLPEPAKSGPCELKICLGRREVGRCVIEVASG
jgi:SAM-dependent methyltransferase